MEKNNEMIDKLKESVTLKLKELDSNNTIDCTLIDYILVMVVNQKNKYEMKDNLALFLGKSSDDFVNWLFDYLPQLKLADNSSVNIKNGSNKEVKMQEQQHSSMINKENCLELNKQSFKTDNLRNNVKEQPKAQVKRKLKSAIVSCFAEENDITKKIKPMNNRRTITHNSNGQKTKQPQSKIKIKPELTNNHNGNTDNIETNITSKNDDFEKPEVTVLDKNEKETKFFVTLDGVKNVFKVDDLFLMDEELDPELMNEELPNVEQMSKKEKFQNLNVLNKSERCRYWPSCLNGNKCIYYHPMIKCNSFPHCRFGDKCLYIHPICKYDSVCLRKDCPFFHTTKRCQPTFPITNHINNITNHSNAMICKYFPNCENPACEFIHLKICHFGISCKTINCPFVHPSTLPHPSQLKWSSSKNNETIEIK